MQKISIPLLFLSLLLIPSIGWGGSPFDSFMCQNGSEITLDDSLSYTHEDQLTQLNHTDYYHLKAPENGKYTIELERLSGNGNVKIEAISSCRDDHVSYFRDNSAHNPKSESIILKKNQDIYFRIWHDQGNTQRSYRLSIHTTQLSPRTLERRVAAGYDDAEERYNGNMYINSSDLELVKDGHNQVIGIRFRNLPIPKGSRILHAYIQFTVDETTSRSTNLKIFGEKSANAAPYTNEKNDITLRSKTSHKAGWSPASWNHKGASGERQKTPDLKGIVQEIVDQDGWESGHALAFIITGSGKRVAVSYEGNHQKAPLLQIEYLSDETSEGGSGSSENEPACYMMTDNTQNIYTIHPDSSADPLPEATSKTISKKLRSEGSAYRASDGLVYAFDSQDDEDQDIDLYVIDPKTGEQRKIKENLFYGTVEAAEFYLDPSTNMETLYLLSHEHHTLLFAFEPNNNWRLKSGYPKSVTGDTDRLASLAIDPRSGDAYATLDYQYNSKPPKLYRLDLSTATTTLLTTFQSVVDAEGLAFGSDNKLYVEGDSQHRLYIIDPATGALTPAAILPGGGDIESISCDGGAEFTIISVSDANLTEGNSGEHNMTFQVSLNKPASEDVSFNFTTIDGNATAGEDYLAEVNQTVTIPAGEQNATISITILGDEVFEGDETFSLQLSGAVGAILAHKEATGTIVEDDPEGMTLSGFVFEDADTNGKRESGENGIQTDTVLKLCQNGHLLKRFYLKSDISDGAYRFTGLSEGNYTILEDESNSSDCTTVADPEGWSSSTPNILDVELRAEDIGDLNFGDFQESHSPIGCIQDGILFQNKPSDVYQLDIVTAGMTKINKLPNYINAAGYNPKDGFVWGYDQNRRDGTILRVGKEGMAYKVTSFGPIEGLGGGFITGDVNEKGELYLLRNSKPRHLFVIDLDVNSSSYLQMVKSFDLTTDFNNKYIADWAFNPKDHKLYAVNNGKKSKSKHLYRIDPQSGQVEDLGNVGLDSEKVEIGAVFFDEKGYFYTYNNYSGKIYRIDLRNPSHPVSTAVLFSENNYIIKKNDGARCTQIGIGARYDYGDAPKSYADATHQIDENLTLGATVDHESESIYSQDALGDDANKTDDEDAVTKVDPIWIGDNQYSIEVTVRDLDGRGAWLMGWIDFDRDGRFENSEKTTISLNSSGTYTLQWGLSGKALHEGESYLRIRLSSDRNMQAKGIVGDGEVEDYRIEIKKPANRFNMWDTDIGGSPIPSKQHQVIKTKRSGETFTLTLASVSGDYTTLMPNKYHNVEVALFAGNENLTNWHRVAALEPLPVPPPNPVMRVPVTFTLPAAKTYKEAWGVIRYLDDENRTREINTTDRFAIRPDRYRIDLSPSSGFKAGEDFNLSVTALDITGHIVTNYEEDFNTSYLIDYNEKKAGCLKGELDLNGADFNHGKVLKTTRYSELGVVDLNISEILGAEYAIVDANDTQESNRLIHKATKELTFAADRLLLDWNFTPEAGRMTFYSSEPDKMGAAFDLLMKAVDKNGQVLKNYTNGCYAKDVDIAMTIDLNGSGAQQMRLLINDLNSSTIIKDMVMTLPLSASQKHLSHQTLKERFFEGMANEHLKFNFKRIANLAQNPLIMTLSDVNVTDGSLTQSVEKNASVTFYYGRAHAINQNAVGNEMNATIDYEVYCKECNKSIFGLEGLKESKDSINWYIIQPTPGCDLESAPQTIALYGGISAITKLSPTILNIKANRVPQKNIIKYTPKSYLLYNRYSASINAHKFHVGFVPKSAGKWIGKGKLGTTVDMKVSKRRSYQQKLDW
ncbi:MAG: hypothetical protein B6D59_04060 [Campylobacteraceae bacterium 4484_4]|nr:MAG: hypothetical protein B6D59_04060 [Campylobacteraceae bacterium 4484_4]